jgi:opacity protein-like surface antigen
MGIRFGIACLVATLVAGGPVALAADAGHSLAAWFQPADGEIVAEDRPEQHQAAADARTPYVAGMIGSSVAAADKPALGGTLLAGQGAVGVSVPRPHGAVRLELEGRQRAALSGTRPAATAGLDGLPAAATIGGEWTTMANVWRDVEVAEHLTAYAGGGLGVGGFAHDADATGPLAASQVTAFGWQAGGGVAYAVTDRLTLDVGGRLYGLEAGGRDPAAGPPAAEIVFAVRVADPLRGWLRR